MKLTIYTIAVAAPYRLSILARLRGSDWLCDELSTLSREVIDILVSMLTDGMVNELGLQHESAQCSGAGIKFVNVAMPDRSVSFDRNAFLRCVEQLADLVSGGSHVAVHCRASIGRSVALPCMFLLPA